MSRGAVYVAFGDKAILYAKMSIASLKIHHDLPVAIITNSKIRGYHCIIAPDEDPGARWAKLSCIDLVPKGWKQFCYLDADTLVRQPIFTGFRILDDDWDMVITPSVNQETDWLWHCDEEDREATMNAWNFHPLVLQGGMFFVKKSKQVNKFFAQWRIEWAKYRDKDQGAFLRALREVPLRIWILGRCWNSSKGVVISHRFGSLKRR